MNAVALRVDKSPTTCPLATDRSYTESHHTHGDQTPRVLRPLYPQSLSLMTQASRLPDLLSIKPNLTTAILPRPSDEAITRAFSLSSPLYVDGDVPLPEPYNTAYPHPLTAYASRGVNPATVRASGYDQVLKNLIYTDPDKVKGSILASSVCEDVVVPALALHSTEGDGNGIPERLWAKFESFGAARLPVGSAGMSPFVRSASNPPLMAPRFWHPIPAALDRCASSIASPPRQRILDQSDMQSDSSADQWLAGSPCDFFPKGRVRHSSSATELSDQDLDVRPQIARKHSAEHKTVAADHLSDEVRQRGPDDWTPYHKTELCGTWQRTRICKYGAHCEVGQTSAKLRSC